MRRYVVLIAYDQPSTVDMSDPAVQQEFFDGHHAFEAYVDEHGRRLSSAALADQDEATTLRHEGDRLVVTDGPFVETVENVGGYYDVELPDLDAALAAAALLPRSYAVEIRPTMVIEGYDPA